MLTGKKGYVGAYYIIQVEGRVEVKYLGYSPKQAEKVYRHDLHLIGKKIDWYPATF